MSWPIALGTAALAMFILNLPAEAQDSISIPLQGTLAVRCTAQAADIAIDKRQGLPAVIVVTVNHKCNARSNLIVSFSQPAEPVAGQIEATYGGQSASARSKQQISFFSPSPVSGTRQLRVSLIGGSEADAQLLAQTLQLSVEAL